MKNLILVLFLSIGSSTLSQIVSVNISSFEYLGSIGNVDYKKVLLNPSIRLGVETNENFIIDLNDLNITYSVGSYSYSTKILDIDTINKKVFVIKYNEDPNESSSKIPVVMELNLNHKEKGLKYKTYSEKDNYTIVKSTLKSKFKVN